MTTFDLTWEIMTEEAKPLSRDFVKDWIREAEEGKAMADETEVTTFVVRDPNRPMTLSQALAYLVAFVIVGVAVLTVLGVWIKLFWIGWVFAG
jgi:hypothetical protein